MASIWERENAHRLRWLALALVTIGLAWRFTRYLLLFPIWGDLLGPIEHCQIAPILFHWVERAMVHWLGTGEWVVRLPAFVACLASLALFWRLARLCLPPLACTIAVAILSVSIWPATMGALAKPYAWDLFFSLVLLTAAVTWLRRPECLGPLVFLAAVIPVAVLASYPVVFVAGAVSLALMKAIWRSPDRKAMALFVLFNLLLVATFAGHYFVVGRTHLASTVEDRWRAPEGTVPTASFASSASHTTTDQDMRRYWGPGFPPARPWAFTGWFLLANTGQMAAYPIGSATGGSILTVLVCLVGAWQLYRQGRRELLVMVAGTFGLGFVAALLHKYPYGASCRISQHLAPLYCLLAGLGVAVLIARLSTSGARWKATLAIFAVLAAIGMGGIVRDCRRPYRDVDSQWARQLTTSLLAHAGNDPVVTVQDVKSLLPVVQWQLGIHGEQVTSRPKVDWRELGRTHSSVWVLSFLQKREESTDLQAQLEQSGKPWRCIEQTTSLRAQERPREPVLYCRTYHWVLEGE
jgi:4-amino-4-deoxy-L-arabinose transferase-like glycosyltransferase